MTKPKKPPLGGLVGIQFASGRCFVYIGSCSGYGSNHITIVHSRTRAKTSVALESCVGRLMTGVTS
jgi:hypothetical protein